VILKDGGIRFEDYFMHNCKNSMQNPISMLLYVMGDLPAGERNTTQNYFKKNVNS
jgi:hypothetical protein